MNFYPKLSPGNIIIKKKQNMKAFIKKWKILNIRFIIIYEKERKK